MDCDYLESLVQIVMESWRAAEGYITIRIEKKKHEIHAVRKWMRKRPAADVQRVDGKRRRTVFTMQRGGTFLKGGVKRSVYKKPSSK